MIYESKYSIGDTVWWVYRQTVSKQHSCPDCLGAKKWDITTPAGGRMTLDCQRCSGYSQGIRLGNGTNIPSLTYYAVDYVVRCLTIGAVRMDTSSNDDVYSYMCGETGIGSGSIYRESSLFETEELALQEALRLTEEATKEQEKTPEFLTGVDFANKSIDRVATEISWSSLYDAWLTSRNRAEGLNRAIEWLEKEDNDGRDELCDELRDALRENPYTRGYPLRDVIRYAIEGDTDRLAHAVALLPEELKNHPDLQPL